MILIQADGLKSWVKLVEAAYDSLGKGARRRVAPQMFHFYVTCGDWQAAGRFAPRNAHDPLDLLVSMRTWLELREMEQARRPFAKCRRRWLQLDPDEFTGGPSFFEASTLIETMASYLAQVRNWDKAEELWEIGKDLMPFAQNAWEGLVQLHALRAFLQANEVFGRVKIASFWEDDAPLMLPRNGEAQREAADKLFHRYARHLAKIVPARERWRFGL